VQEDDSRPPSPSESDGSEEEIAGSMPPMPKGGYCLDKFGSEPGQDVDKWVELAQVVAQVNTLYYPKDLRERLKVRELVASL